MYTDQQTSTRADNNRGMALPSGLPLILMADDSGEDCRIMQMALKRLEHPCALRTVADGEALLQALKDEGQRPDLILLDLNLPIKSGLEALMAIKGDPLLKSIPVVIWSTSQDPADVLQCYQLKTNSFFTKPDSLEKVVEMMRVMTQYWFRTAQLPPAWLCLA